MACMADYDEDCKGKKPEGCMCRKCCEDKIPKDDDKFQCANCGEYSMWSHIKKVNKDAKSFNGRLHCPKCGHTYSVGFDQFIPDVS